MGTASLVCVGGIPPVVAFIVFVLVQRLAGGRTPAAPVAAAGMAWAAGVCAGYIAAIRVVQLATLWPTDGWQWLPWLALLATTLAGGAASPVLPRWVIPAVAALVSVLVMAVVLPRWVPFLPRRPFWMAVGAVLISGCWLTLETGWRQRTDRMPALALGLAGAASALLLAFTGNLRFGQVAGLAAAAFGGVVLATRAGRVAGAERGAIPGFLVSVLGMLVVGYLYSADTAPGAAYLLAGLSPAFLSAAIQPAVARRLGRWHPALELAVVLIPSGVALWLARPQETW